MYTSYFSCKIILKAINTLVTAERIRIKGDGKVGLGTTAPEEELHVRTTDGRAIKSERQEILQFCLSKNMMKMEKFS